MLLDAILGRFLDQSPMTVAVRSTLEYALDAAALDALFAQTASPCSERQLLFSTCVDLMTTVVCRIKPTIHAAYQANDHISVSVSAVYRRLARVSTDAGRQLVRHTAERLEPILRQSGWANPDLLPGYRVKVLDGNHLAHTQRRIKLLRNVIAGPLPGHSLVDLRIDHNPDNPSLAETRYRLVFFFSPEFKVAFGMRTACDGSGSGSLTTP